MLTLRKRYPALWESPLDLVLRKDDVAVIERGDLTVVANFSDEPFEFVPAGMFTIEFESDDDAAEIVDGRLVAAAESTVIVRRGSE